MKIICTQENLKKALFSVERITGKKSILPILENILFVSQGNVLFLSATNLELGITVQLPAKIEGEGKIAVPVKILSSFVSNLNGNAIIHITIQGQEMLLVSENHKAIIQCFDPEEFPLIPTPKKEENVFTFDAKTIKAFLQKNMIAVTPSNIRVEFSGVYVVLSKNTLFFVSTDSFRLIETKIPLVRDDVKKEEVKIILPHQTVSEIIRLISEDTQVITLLIEDNQVFIRIGEGISLVSRIIQGNFPDYKGIIPTSFTTTAFLSREKLLQSIRMSLVFLFGGSGEVTFSFQKDKHCLILQTQSEKTGKNTSTIPAEISGKDLTLTFNPKYVIDALQVIDGEDIVLSLNSESSPAVFTPKGVKDIVYQYILMPIRR